MARQDLLFAFAIFLFTNNTLFSMESAAGAQKSAPDLRRSNSVITSIKRAAFLPQFTDEPDVRSQFTDAAEFDVQQALRSALIQLPYKTVTEEVATANSGSRPRVRTFIDLTGLEGILVPLIKTKIGPEIAEAAKNAALKESKKEFDAHLSLLQRHPKKGMFVALLIGISIPFAVSALLEKYGL